MPEILTDAYLLFTFVFKQALKLVESVCVDDENKYIQLINSCPSQEWRDTLNARYANYKKAQEVK